ncbi:unnamed protein product [Malus baccata var. baccata]
MRLLFIVVLIQTVVIIIFAFTVFRVKNTKIKLNKVTITRLKLINNSTIPKPDSKISLTADVSMKNPNVASFRYRAVPLSHSPLGVSRAQRTMRMNVIVDIITNSLTSNPNVRSGVESGLITMSSHFRILGRVKPQNPNPSPEGVILPRIIFVAEDDNEQQQQDDDGNAVVGLHPSVINSYPKFPFSKEASTPDSSTCSICLCDYKDAEMLRMMPECRHYFHLLCLDAWLRLKGSCPVCRNSPLPTPLSTPLQEVVPLSQYPADRRWRSFQWGVWIEWLLGFGRLGNETFFLRTPNLFKNLGTWRGGVRSSIFVLSAFALLISIATLSKFNSLGSFHVTYALCSYVNTDQSQSRITKTLETFRDLEPSRERSGLDSTFRVGTGTFAARMREFNVTIVAATINRGAPFNEMIALRGLVPLYLTINQRLPFFDTPRVLSPGGFLWIGSFFCLEDLSDYFESLKMLRYKKHKWVVVPKLDKDDDDGEVFFSAVLEKPGRLFRQLCFSTEDMSLGSHKTLCIVGGIS